MMIVDAKKKTARTTAEVRPGGPRAWPLGPLSPGVVSVLAGLLLWKGLALLAPNPPNLLPAPEVVGARLWELIAGGALWPHIAATLTEAGLGFLLAAAGGLALGYPVAKSQLLEAFVAPYIAGAQAVPVVAVAPLLVLWFGLDLTPKVITCAVIVFFPILVNTVVGLRSVERSYIEAAQTFGANRWQILRYVEAPLAAPALFGGLKLGLTLAMTGAVVGEFVAANAGLGFLLNYGRSIYDTPLVFAALVLLAAVAVVAFRAVDLLARRLIDWE